MTLTRSLAKAVDIDIVDNDHGWLHLGGHFDYEDGGCQGIGRGLDMEFIRLFMDVFGVEKLRQVNGRSCWVTHSYDNITLIEPLHAKDGQAFDIDRWAADARARGAALDALKKKVAR